MPAPAARRLPGVDAVRGIALLGVFVMHFHLTGWLRAGGLGEVPVPIEWLQTQTSSRAMSLFVLLAGVSVALMTGGSRLYSGRAGTLARRRIAARAAALFVIGLGIGSFAPSVLEYYAVLLVFLLAFTTLRARTLGLLAALAVPAVTLYAVWVLDRHAEWLMTETPNGLELLINPDRWGDYLFSLVFTGGGFQTVYGIPLVLAGLALGRLDLRARTVRGGLVVGGTSLALAALLVSWLAPMLFPDWALTEHTASNPLQLLRMPGLYAVSAVGIVFMIGVAALLLGVLSALLDRPAARWLLRPLTALGSMTLTWYAGHLAFLSLVGPQTRFSVAAFAGFIAIVMVVSVLWLRAFRRGPLEWLVHRISAAAAQDRVARGDRDGAPPARSPRDAVRAAPVATPVADSSRGRQPLGRTTLTALTAVGIGFAGVALILGVGGWVERGQLPAREPAESRITTMSDTESAVREADPALSGSNAGVPGADSGMNTTALTRPGVESVLSADDREFLAALARGGEFAARSEGQLLDAGRAVCAEVSGGADMAEAAERLGERTGLSAAGLVRLTVAAWDALCGRP